jgi:hypothetical protein
MTELFYCSCSDLLSNQQRQAASVVEQEGSASRQCEVDNYKFGRPSFLCPMFLCVCVLFQPPRLHPPRLKIPTLMRGPGRPASVESAVGLSFMKPPFYFGFWRIFFYFY